MRLEFKSEHLSIKRFDPIETGDFTVITGINGSGKTHLLRAIRNGSVSADLIRADDIVFFDLFEFKLENETEYMLRQVMEEKDTVWSNFIDVDEQQLSSYRRADLEKLAHKFFTPEEISAIESIANDKSTQLLALSARDIPSDELLEKFNKYKRELEGLFHNLNSKRNRHGHNFFQLLRSIRSFPHNMDKALFLDKYEISVLKENLIPTQLGKIFVEYRIGEFIRTHEEYERNDRTYGMPPRPSGRITDSHDRYAGIAPWETINEFLKAYTEGRYSITYPDPIPVAQFVSVSSSFKPELINNEKNIPVPYGDLSSGEKVLFMLALCIFKASSTKSIFPKLVLLDEVDATLHPSMIKNLLAVINDVLLPKGTKVVLATHSPTTVALVPEECIYVVNPSGSKRIAKMTKNEAIQVLTEGYMTIEDTIKVFDQTTERKTYIISEGNNVDYIRKAISIFAKDHEDQIRIMDTIKDISDKDRLKTIFEFFTRVHHSTSIFVVWDPDCTKYKNFVPKNNTYPVVLTKNSANTLCKSAGIESLFDDSYFDESEIIKTLRGDQIVSRAFDSKKKQMFKSRMLDNANAKSFRMFEDLLRRIVSVVEENSNEHMR